MHKNAIIISMFLVFSLITPNFKCEEYKDNVVNIGEILLITRDLGFVQEWFKIKDTKVYWVTENNKVNGNIELNYHIIMFDDKLFPRVMATGLIISHDGKILGKDKIVKITKEKINVEGKLSVNVSLDAREKIVLDAIVWTTQFPPHVQGINGSFLRYFTFGIFDIRKVKIEIGVIKSINKQDYFWIHSRYDICNTGYTPAKGKDSINNYRMRIINCKHVFAMGTGEPKVADIDRDGKAEIIFATQNGYLYVVEEGRKVDWKCDVKGEVSYIPPELGDVDGDGYYEVLIANDNFVESPKVGLRVVDKDGKLLAEWLNPEGGFPLGEPRAADIDGDGKDEILIGLLGDEERGNKFYALKYENGSLKELWNYPAYFWIKYTPAVADLNNDGKMEIIFTSYDLCVYCLDANGNLLWKYITKGGIQHAYTGAIERKLAHPVAADINNDGYMEIIVNTAIYDKPEWSAVYCLDYEGNLIWKYKPNKPLERCIAVGDINNDGNVEIVFGDVNGTIYVLKSDGNLLWKHTLPEFYFKKGPISVAVDFALFYPYIADLDGNGYAEIIVVAWCHGVFIFSHDGKLIKQWPRPLGEFGYRGGAIADIDGDGDLEIIVCQAGKLGLFGKVGIIDQ